MAKRLSSPPARRTYSRYPWHEWTDGSWWQITRGEDFTISILAMKAQLYGRAASTCTRDQRRLVEIITPEEPDTIAFRFHPIEANPHPGTSYAESVRLDREVEEWGP